MTDSWRIELEICEDICLDMVWLLHTFLSSLRFSDELSELLGLGVHIFVTVGLNDEEAVLYFGHGQALQVVASLVEGDLLPRLPKVFVRLINQSLKFGQSLASLFGIVIILVDLQHVTSILVEMKVLVVQKFTALHPHLKLMIQRICLLITLIVRINCASLWPKLIEKFAGLVAEEFYFVVEAQTGVKVA